MMAAPAQKPKISLRPDAGVLERDMIETREGTNLREKCDNGTIMVMDYEDKRQRQKAHTGRARGRSSAAARLLLARRVQGASGVMMCGKHFTSIMFFFTKGQCWARLFGRSGEDWN